MPSSWRAESEVEVEGWEEELRAWANEGDGRRETEREERRKEEREVSVYIFVHLY